MHLLANTVRQFKDKHLKIFVAATGAGAGIQQHLWNIPGASSYIVGSCFPYSTHEFDRFIGFRLGEKYCSQEGALELAMAAFVRANESQITHNGLYSNNNAIGLGVSAAVSTDRERKGQNVVHVAVCHQFGIHYGHVVMPKKDTTWFDARTYDGQLVDQIAINAICNAMGLAQSKVIISGFEGDRPDNWSGQIEKTGNSFTLSLHELAESTIREQFFKRPVFTPFDTKNTGASINTQNVLFMPGTFNPIHDGHRDIVYKVEKLTGKHVVFMTTADSPHKKGLTVPQMLQKVAMMRMERFGHYEPRSIIFTQNDPLFIQKATQWPNAAFVVGYDTAARILDKNWGQEITPMLHTLRNLGTRFYVCGRILDGQTKTRYDLPIPDMFSELFIDVPGTGTDHSSTSIRNGTG